MAHNFEYDVRIPQVLVKQMMEGEVTVAMLAAMNVLHMWADWRTGRVRRVSASGLHFACNSAYSVRTFSEALRKLEAMGWITRHTVAGSHKWYPVTIHNYKWVDDAGKVHILNPKELVACAGSKTGGCGEASYEGSDEASEEASDEGSERLLSLTESSNLPLNDFQNQPQHSAGGGRPNQERSKPVQGQWDFSLVGNDETFKAFVDRVNPKREDGTRGKWQPEGFSIARLLDQKDSDAHAFSAAIHCVLDECDGPVTFEEFSSLAASARAQYSAEGASA